MFSSLHILRKGIIVVQFAIPLRRHASMSLRMPRYALFLHAALLLQLQPLLRVLIHHVSNTDCWYNLQQVRRQSFEQSSHALALDRLPGNIHNASVRSRMADSALTL